jgi:hypothetical protein
MQSQEQEHTPPMSGWRAEFVEETWDWCVVAPASEPDAEGMTFQPFVATLSDSYGDDAARLIAAAPDLLEALQGLLAAYQAALDFISDETFDMAALHPGSWAEKSRAAIARATQPTGGKDD